MLVLGIDPGYAIVGFGVLRYASSRFSPVEYGAITTKAGDKYTVRISQIYEATDLLIKKHRPDAMAIEKLYFNTNSTTAIDVAQARGVVLLAAVNNSVPVFEYTPLQVKQAVTGYGRAEKRQVIEMVRTFLGLDKPPKPDDTADALAIAICHAHSSNSMLDRSKNI